MLSESCGYSIVLNNLVIVKTISGWSTRRTHPKFWHVLHQMDEAGRMIPHVITGGGWVSPLCVCVLYWRISSFNRVFERLIRPSKPKRALSARHPPFTILKLLSTGVTDQSEKN